MQMDEWGGAPPTNASDRCAPTAAHSYLGFQNAQFSTHNMAQWTKALTVPSPKLGDLSSVP